MLILLGVGFLAAIVWYAGGTAVTWGLRRPACSEEPLLATTGQLKNGDGYH